MTQRVFTADLLSNQPPYNPRELGSSCVFADARETAQRTPAANHGTDSTQQQGYNQVYFMENVMPSSRGITSVGYQSVVPQLDSFVPKYVLECRSTTGELTYVGVDGSNVLHWYDESGWKLYDTVFADAEFVPQAVVVRGQSYFYFGNYEVLTWDSVAEKIVPIAIEAIEMGAILGICSGGSQLVLFSATIIYYSAALDATDFLPSLATGAGSTGILALKGTIVTCLPLGQDFVVYTQYSAVHARYTGNFALPFVYNEVAGSTGIVTQKHVAYNTNTGSHIAYVNVGLQEITPSGVASIFPDISDQVSKGVVAFIDELTGMLSYDVIQAVNVKLTFVANRWLCISLGIDPATEIYKEAYIFDSSLQRWGRIKVTHSCIFEWAGSAAVEGIKTYQDLSNAYPLYQDVGVLLYRDLGSLAAKYSALNKQKLAIMSDQGQVCLLVPTESGQLAGNNIGTDAAMPCALVGRIKLFRDQGVVFQWTRLNKLVQGDIALIGHDYNGAPIKRVTNLSPSLIHAGTYSKAMNADSVSVEIQGSFVLTDLQICLASGGTHKQFAPPVKKFKRLLYSQIYSIEGDAATLQLAQPVYDRGRFDPIIEDAFATIPPSFVFGEIRPVLILFTQPFQVGDAVGLAHLTYTSGTLTSVSVNHSQLYQSGDAVAVTHPSYTSGTLFVALISHDQIYQSGDAVQVAHPTYVSGALT
jgi:hypothetical protein